VSQGPDMGGLSRLLGIRPGTIGDGRCSFALTVAPHPMNPYGAVHGGVVYSLVDQAMGGALFSRLEPGERCTTLEIKINYLASVTAGELTAQASVLQRTKRTGVLEAKVHGDGGTLVAAATGTFFILSARAADGS